MDQFYNPPAATRGKPVFRPDMPIETWVFGEDAYSDAPLFGGEVLLSPKQVADVLNVPLSTLDDMIERGDGPPYFRFGPRLRRFLPSIVRDWARHRVEIVEFANTSTIPGDEPSNPENLEVSLHTTRSESRRAPTRRPSSNGRTKG